MDVMSKLYERQYFHGAEERFEQIAFRNNRDGSKDFYVRRHYPRNWIPANNAEYLDKHDKVIFELHEFHADTLGRNVRLPL